MHLVRSAFHLAYGYTQEQNQINGFHLPLPVPGGLVDTGDTSRKRRGTIDPIGVRQVGAPPAPDADLPQGDGRLGSALPVTIANVLRRCLEEFDLATEQAEALGQMFGILLVGQEQGGIARRSAAAAAPGAHVVVAAIDVAAFATACTRD